MFTAYHKSAAALVMGLGLVAAATTWAADNSAKDEPKAKSCCEAKLACCTAKRACCADASKIGCCAKGMACCKNNQACCDKPPQCCIDGKDCCKEGKACCGQKGEAKQAAKAACCQTDAVAKAISPVSTK